ncbi:MAG: dihydrofolate reductase [Oscillospiraceae bacterium]
MEAVVAVYSDWGIGCCGTQPVVVSEDRRHFRAITGNGAVIVGRKTLEDFPGGKPLKGRVNIVITHQAINIPGAVVVHSFSEAAKKAREFENAFVIGGASVFNAMLPYCERVHATIIEAEPQSDTFFPNLDKLPEWYCAAPGETKEENGLRYRFAVYDRVNPQSDCSSSAD